MKTNLWGSLSPRKRKLISWVLGLLLFYAVLGFFILPPIIRAVAVKDLSAQLDRRVSIQRVKLNPFVPSITIQGLLILDKDGQPFISWDEVYVNFQLSSVFSKAWTFGEISVTAPYARAEMNKDYTFNFSDLIRKFTPPVAAVPKQPSKPLLLCVKRLSIRGARLSVADFTTRTPFKRIIGPMDLALANFRTEPDKNSFYWFAGDTDTGENFYWRGRFCLDPLGSEGQLTIGGITLTNFAPLYQDLSPFEIRGGQIAMRADYRFELSASNRAAAVTNAAFGLWNLRLAQPGSPNDLVDLLHLAVMGVSADFQMRQAEVSRIMVSGGQFFIQRGKDKSVHVAELSRPNENTTNTSGEAGGVLFLLRSVTNAVAMLLNTTNQGAGVIHEVTVTNCAAHFEDFANSRPATLDLDNITLDAKNISNLPNTNLTAGLSMRWNGQGKIAVAVNALISPSTADVHLDLNNLNLNTLDPYLESQFNLLIPSGNFGMNGDVHVRTPPNGLPDVTFQGDTWLDSFRSVDGVMAEDLLKWRLIRVSGIDAKLNPMSVAIKEIYMDNVVPRIVIETNGVINLLAALCPAVTNGVGETNAPMTVKNSAAPVAGTNALQGMPPFSIASIVVTNAQISFTDRSVNPNVNMVIEQAGGTIMGISSAELQHGDINLHALVDGVGPAQITGHINPFSGTQTNEVKILMSSMDLLPTSPYSGKFAGYRIARGDLNVNLEYDIVGRKLKSQNIITINQFEFGEKVDSTTATKLPVRLAVAILKDREGNIVLNVPIEGSLDDPKFRIGKVVVRALVDILTKVATSPFSLLGAAFGGGGEELNYEDFPPGSAELPDASKQKLNVLVKALYDRPALQLEISGSVDPVSDRDGLQRIAFEKELRTRQWRSLRTSVRATITPDRIVLTPEDRAHLIKKLYDDALSDGRISPALLAANTNLAALAKQIQSPPTPKEKQAEMLMKDRKNVSGPTVASTSKTRPIAPADPREALLLAIIPVSDSDFETLAIERAKAVRAYVLTSGKVEAGRLFLAQNQGGELRQNGTRVYLQLN